MATVSGAAGGRGPEREARLIPETGLIGILLRVWKEC